MWSRTQSLFSFVFLPQTHCILVAVRLMSLDVSHNSISALDIPKYPHEKLHYLSLDFNHLTLDPRTLESIGKSFPNLIRLSVSHQREQNGSINRTIREIVVDKRTFPCLQYLNASCNQLISLECIKGNDYILNRLILHSNGMTKIPSFIDCRGITVLDISNNQLSTVSLFSSLVGRLPLLTTIDFSGNCTSFHLKDLPINGSSNKTLDLIKVEPSSDLCRVSFSNGLVDTPSPPATLQSSSQSTITSTTSPMMSPSSPSFSTSSSVSSSSTNFSQESRCDLSPQQPPKQQQLHSNLQKHVVFISNDSPLAPSLHRRVTTTVICYGISIESEGKKNLATLMSSGHGDIRRLFVSCCQILKVNPIDPPDDFNIILCLVICHPSSSGIEVSFAAYGNEVSVSLLDSSKVSSLSNLRHLGYKRYIRDLLSEKLKQGQATILSPMIGHVVMEEKTSLLLLGIKLVTEMELRKNKSIKGDDPFEILLNNLNTLDDNLRTFSEDIKHLAGLGHLVMAIQPSTPHSDEENEDVQSYSSDGNGDFPEKYKSWDYILQENERKEKRLEDKMPIPSVVPKNSVMMSEYTLSTLRVQRDYVESSKGSNSYLQLFRI